MRRCYINRYCKSLAFIQELELNVTKPYFASHAMNSFVVLPLNFIVDFPVLFTMAMCVLFLVWIYFHTPFNLFKDYSKYGYEDKIYSNDKSKRMKVNMALRRRKIGELPPPYPNSWYGVIESDQIHKGEVKEIFVLGKNLVAWRGKKTGTVFVSDAYCIHLGAHLGVGGSVKGDCIECPFHKWTFNGNSGEVDEVPYSNTPSSQLRTKLGGMQMWPVVETNGFVYIWYHENREEPSWYPEGTPEIASGRWNYHGRSEFQVTCHIQEIPENGADVAHLNALHDTPAFFSERYSGFASILDKFIKHCWSATWTANEITGHKHESIIKLSHYLSIFSGKLNIFHVQVDIKQIGAGIVIMNFVTPFGNGVLVQSVTPVEPLLQKIVHRFYSEPRFIRPFAFIVLQSEAQQISRDVRIWNRKCYLKNPLLVKEDSTIKLFRRWFRQFYSENNFQTNIV